MIQRTEKKMIVLTDTKSGVFEQAYFVLKSEVPDVDKDALDDMISEAAKIVSARYRTKKKNKRDIRGSVLCFLFGVLSGLAFCLLCCIVF